MLPQDERKKMVLKLFTALKDSNIFPGYDMGQIKEAAIRAEQRIFEESKTREEYVNGMDERFKRIEKAAGESRRDRRSEQKQEIPFSASDSWTGRAEGFNLQDLSTHNNYERDRMFSGNLSRFERSGTSESGVIDNMQNGSQDWFTSIRNASAQMDEGHSITKNGMPQKYGSQEMGSKRDRSNSCTIQNSMHKQYSVGSQEFKAGFMHGMNFLGDLSSNDKYRNDNESMHHINEERGINAMFEQPLYNGYFKEAAYMSMRNEVDGNQEYLKYNMKSNECRSKSEVFTKAPIMRNDEKVIAPNPNYLHAGKYFMPQKHSEQRIHLQNNMYTSQARANNQRISDPRSYSLSGYVGNNHMASNMMHGSQSMFQESAMGPEYQNRGGRGTNTFLANSSNGSNIMADGWLGFSSVFDSKGTGNSRKSIEKGMKSSPIFFNQQVQHQQYYNSPQKHGEIGHIHTKPRAAMTLDLSQRFEKQLGQIDMFDNDHTKLGESMNKTDYYFNSGSQGMEPGFKSESFADYINMQNGIHTDTSYANADLNSSFRFDYLQSNMNDSHNTSKELSYDADPIDCSTLGFANYGNQYANINDSNSGYKNDSFDYNASSKPQANENMSGYAINKEHKKELSPDALADIDEFIISNGLNKVLLNSLEILNMKSKLEEGVNAISKSLKVYNSFDDAFPKSKLKVKYKHARMFIEKQIECMKHNIYFLKVRNVGGLIDQINSLIVDMSHELKSANESNTIINYGDCLRDALKAYSEKKKRLSIFGLNLIGKNKN
ncbi:hypothetical protein CWI41_081700 [Ordospora colligata]|nr:hypothetical protein CWI41_081700 [Ordospora colligata]